MPRFAANLSYLFLENEFTQRFAAARAAGFAGVEFHFPYAHDPETLAQVARSAGVEVVLFNLPPGDWDAGERGIACHPDRVAEFLDGVGQAVEYAKVLGCKRLNCLAGLVPHGVSDATALETLVDNLRFAAGMLARVGMQLMLEPINTRDMPGFCVNCTAQALDIIAAVGADNLFVQYDVYHAQVTEGDLANTLAANLAHIGHVQIADNPGRHEPGSGEINFPFLFGHLDRIGYAGWVGCEYKPATNTAAGLGWLAPWQNSSTASN
jgi:hydroxypyruvate isomerase